MCAWLIPVEHETTIYSAQCAALMPESAVVEHCAVEVVRVVVTVIRAEHHAVVVTERITKVTRVPGYLHPVVVSLAEYNKRTVLGVSPGAIA